MSNQTDKEILQQFGQIIIEDVKQNAVTQKRVASHKAESELRMEDSDSELKVIDGAGYIQWGWEYGRGPGKQPPSSAIMQWIIDKRLPVPEKKRKSVAFLIARKIKERGTLLFLQGGNSGVLTDVITQSRIDTLKETFATKYLNEARSEIIKTFQ